MMHYSSSWSVKRAIRKRKKEKKPNRQKNISKRENCANNKCRPVLVFNFVTPHLQTLLFYQPLTNLSFRSHL